MEDISEDLISDTLNGSEANVKDEHIHQLLESYLNDEEDGSIKPFLLTTASNAQDEASLMKVEEEEGDDGGDDDDKKINIKSQVEQSFQRRVALHPKQVMRYAYGGQPLWCTHPPPQEAVNIPCCESCGSQRVFEAQLMPALLQYFPVNERTSLKISSCKGVDQAFTADE